VIPTPLRKAAYAVVAVYGLFAALAPRLASSLTVRLGLLGFENTGGLEAEAWYLRAVRAAGVGLLAAGGAGLLLEDRATGREADDVEAVGEPAAEGTDDGPVQVEVDDDAGTGVEDG